MSMEQHEQDDIKVPESLVHFDNIQQGPGHLLKEMREKLGLSTAEVALFLHLSKNVIEIIEQDDYLKLPAITFARGYLRAYAKYLNLNPDEIVQQFNQMGLIEQERSPIQRIVSPDMNTSDKPVKWLSYFIALSLGCLVLIWWHNHGNTFMPTEVLTKVENNNGLIKPMTETAAVSVQTTDNQTTNGPIETPTISPDGQAPVSNTSVTEDEATDEKNDVDTDVPKPSTVPMDTGTSLEVATQSAGNNPPQNNTPSVPVDNSSLSSSTSMPQPMVQHKKQSTSWKNPDLE